MSVIIKLNGVVIGEATMTANEMKEAEAEGFTITRKGE